MSLYWLCYRRAGQFAGAAVFEAQFSIEAKLKAAVAGLPVGFDCECLTLSPALARQVPKSLIGHTLSAEELIQLKASIIPKKPVAASARWRGPRKRSA
jgi:hypothetical protein